MPRHRIGETLKPRKLKCVGLLNKKKTAELFSKRCSSSDQFNSTLLRDEWVRTHY